MNNNMQEKEKNKKRWIMAVSGCILLIFLIVLGSVIYRSRYRRTIIDTYNKDQYTLTIYHIGEPDFPFGKSDCQLILTEGGRQIDKQDIELYKDGKFPDKENFTVKWQADGVRVIVHGEEQDDVACELNYSK